MAMNNSSSAVQCAYIIDRSENDVMVIKVPVSQSATPSKWRQAIYLLNSLCFCFTNDTLPFFALPSFEICISCICHSSFFIFITWHQPFPQCLILRFHQQRSFSSLLNFCLSLFTLFCSLIIASIQVLPQLNRNVFYHQLTVTFHSAKNLVTNQMPF